MKRVIPQFAPLLGPHWKYLRYVILHKLYVARAGVIINGWSLPWLWRLLVHDLSKFSRTEWGPYVRQFYGESVSAQAEREVSEHFAAHPDADMSATGRDHTIAAHVIAIETKRKHEYNAAWLHHLHANPHHWQHWMLHLDNGRTLVLNPPNAVANEMIADWLAAGPKVLRRPDMRECIAETIVWYTSGASKAMTMRADVRHHVEATLAALAQSYGLHQWASVVARDAMTRETISLTSPSAP